jgi:hypothetical protein
LLGGAAASRYATRGTLTTKNKSGQELGDFSKTVKPAKLEEGSIGKARIPKLQENLLKRTAKIETQAGAALAKQKLLLWKEVLLQLKAKDLANAEAENACRYALPVPYGLILIPY